MNENPEDPGELAVSRVVEALTRAPPAPKKRPSAPRPVRRPGELNSDYWLRVREARLVAEEEPK